MKGELRKDPATGKWVLVRRPGVRSWEEGEACPFCPGSEPLTPEGLATVAAEDGWLSEEEARRQFWELCYRGDRIARSLR